MSEPSAISDKFSPLAARYGEASAPSMPSMALNGTLETILGHRSIRSFSDKPLPDGVVELLAAAAQSAPSTSNLQAFSMVAVQDVARKSRLSKLAAHQRHVAQAPLLLMFVADLGRLRRLAGDLDEPSDGLDYKRAFLSRSPTQPSPRRIV